MRNQLPIREPVIEKSSSVILIKYKDTSLNEFYDTVAVYAMKYPSHFGYVVIDEIENRLVKMDACWWTYQQFKDDIVRYAKPNSTIIAVLTVLELDHQQNPVAFRSLTPTPQRIFVMHNPDTALLSNMDESEFMKTTIFVSTGSVCVKENNIHSLLNPRGFLNTMKSALGKDKYADEFIINAKEYITTKENNITLPAIHKLVIYNPRAETDKLTFIRAVNGNPMKELSNGITVSDDIPLVPFKGMNEKHVLVNYATYANDTTVKLQNFKLFNHLIDSFDLCTSTVSQLRREVFLSGKKEKEIPVEIDFPDAINNDDEDGLLARYGY